MQRKMSSAIKIVVILIWAGLQTVDTQTLSEKRIFQSKQFVKRIERQLVGIEHRNYGCNGTVYEVIDKMEYVSSRVKQLYRGRMYLHSYYCYNGSVGSIFKID